MTHNFDDALEAISSDGKAEVMLGGRPVTIRARFVEDVRAEKLAPALGDAEKGAVVLHAPRDEIVGIDKATRIFTAARHPNSFVTLDEADHPAWTRAEGLTDLRRRGDRGMGGPLPRPAPACAAPRRARRRDPRVRGRPGGLPAGRAGRRAAPYPCR